MRASDSYLDLSGAPYALYGVKYIDPVSLAPLPRAKAASRYIDAAPLAPLPRYAGCTNYCNMVPLDWAGSTHTNHAERIVRNRMTSAFHQSDSGHGHHFAALSDADSWMSKNFTSLRPNEECMVEFLAASRRHYGFEELFSVSLGGKAVLSNVHPTALWSVYKIHFQPTEAQMEIRFDNDSPQTGRWPIP